MLRSIQSSTLTALVAVVVLCGCPRFETDRDPEEPPNEQTGAAAAVEQGPIDADAPEEFTEMKSGLKYRIRRKGEGEQPERSDTVKVHYKGWLDDGTVFDSSYRRGRPIEFALNEVIAGWTEGLQHVREGGMIELIIPSELGYGARGAPPDIPPHATLHFLVELIEVK